MTEQLDLTQVRRRAFRDSAMDGLVEMMLGIWFFYVSGFLYKDGKALPLALMPLVFFLILMGIKSLKNKFVYPRLGYVKLPADKVGSYMKVVPYFLVAGLVVLVAILFISGDYKQAVRWYRWMPILYSIFLAGVFVGLARVSGLFRYYIYGAVTVLSPIPFIVIPFAGKLGAISNHFLALSGFFIIVGSFIFIRFLRKNPILAEETRDGKN